MNTTDAKTDALIRAFTTENPHNILGRCGSLLAQLMSTDKLTREFAKKRVRELIKIGNDLLAKDKAEQKLADFANRNEP